MCVLCPVCTCVCVCVRACVRVCVCACVRVFDSTQTLHTVHICSLHFMYSTTCYIVYTECHPLTTDNILTNREVAFTLAIQLTQGDYLYSNGSHLDIKRLTSMLSQH